MAMTRNAASLWLISNMNELFTEVSIDTADDLALDGVIEQALLLRGVAYDDLPTAAVASADVPAFLLVLRYVGIRRVYDAALNRVDIQISDPNVSKNKSQFVRQLENSLKTALEEAEPYIVTAAGAVSAFQSFAIAFGDPACVSEFGYQEQPPRWC